MSQPIKGVRAIIHQIAFSPGDLNFFNDISTSIQIVSKKNGTVITMKVMAVLSSMVCLRSVQVFNFSVIFITVST